VAAVNAGTSYPNQFIGGAQNPVEYFSSDGPRRVFYLANGTPITPGNFSSTGGAVRQKPDVTAADGVATSVPGFGSFFGTSAAAPHAAAIAALLLSYNPTLTTTDVRSLLTSTALDTEAAGVDRDSGFGIVMAPAVLQAAPPLVLPAPVLSAEPAITPGTQNTIFWQAVTGESLAGGGFVTAAAAAPMPAAPVASPQVFGDLAGTSDDSEGEAQANAMAQDSPILNAAKPNLTPYQPVGWSDKIVVSTSTGTSTDSNPLTTADSLYVDWAVLNNGVGSATSTYFTELYVDEVLRQTWSTAPPHGPNVYAYVVDYPIGSLTAGSHTIRIKTDSTGVISESNEGDNEYTKTISVNAVSVVEYYAERADNSNFISPLNSGWIQQLQYTFSGLTPGQTYYYRVKARKGAFASDWSNVESSQQESPPPVVRTLTIASSTPDSGVVIGVSPNDNNGAGGGTTPFSRLYNQGTVVTLTAPAVASGNSFQKWQRDGVDFSLSATTPVTMDVDHILTAVYAVVNPDTAYVTGKTLGSLRNNYTGFVGMKLTVGSNPLTVSALARHVVSGNTGSHLVKLVNAADGNDVPGGSVTIATSGAPTGQFKYANLSSPVTLAPGVTYYVVSQETNGGDSWYYFDTTVTTTAVATEVSGIYGPGSSWYPLGTASHTYGPVDFKYSIGIPSRMALSLGRERSEGWVLLAVPNPEVATRDIVLRLTGHSGGRYVLQSSPDLVHWTSLESLTVSNQEMELQDPGPTDARQQFYRLAPAADGPDN
jgi:hypothetical protein